MKEKKQMSRVKQTLICLAITLVVGLVYFYFELPALNLHSPAFYTFVFILCAVYCVCAVFTSRIGLTSEERQLLQVTGFREFFAMMKRHCMIPFFLCLALIVLYLGGSLFSSVILRSGSYTKLLTVDRVFCCRCRGNFFRPDPHAGQRLRLQAWRPKTGGAFRYGQPV